jgi:NTE family protein
MPDGIEAGRVSATPPVTGQVLRSRFAAPRRELGMSLVGRRAPVLPHSPLFTQLDAKALDDIRRHARPRRYAAGDLICREGARTDSVLVLQRGFADVYVTSRTEVRTAIVGHLRAGDIVGEVGALTGLPRSATVVASSDASALEIKREEFDRLLASHPPLQTNLTRILGARLASSNSALRGTSHDVVALVVGREHPYLADRVLEAARRATSRPAAIIDLRGASDAIARATLAPAWAVPGQAYTVAGVPQALEHLDRLKTGHEMVILVVGGEQRELARLLARAHRVVALASRGEALGLAPCLRAGRRLADLVLLGVAGDDSIPPLAECRLARRFAGEPTASDIAWLGRHLSRTKLGLALGAGGAKCFAHAGVIDTLQRAGYTVDCVSGSSMGAVTAVWLALGMSGADIADTLSKQWALRPVVDEIFRKGAASDGVRILGQLLRETTGDRSFADLKTPATVMTADLAGRCPAPLTSGALWEALMAALAIPGLYPPWVRGEQRLVDAVSLTPVPLESAIEAGADVTIAVNVLGREFLPSWPAAGAGPTAPSATLRPGHVRDTVVEVLELAQIDASARQAARADVPITPQFGPGTWRDMHLGPLFFAAGAESAEAQLSRLRSLARPCPA